MTKWLILIIRATPKSDLYKVHCTLKFYYFFKFYSPLIFNVYRLLHLVIGLGATDHMYNDTVPCITTIKSNKLVRKNVLLKTDLRWEHDTRGASRAYGSIFLFRPHSRVTSALYQIFIFPPNTFYYSLKGIFNGVRRRINNEVLCPYTHFIR